VEITLLSVQFFGLGFRFVHFESSTHMLNRRHLIQAAALSAMPMGMALAQPAFPSKPLRIVVPFGAGGIVAAKSMREG
jgi:hypothetical protein